MRFSPLVTRIAGEGADAWLTHYEAMAARERGEDVVILSVGDPDLDTPEPVIERAVERLRGGDTHYAPAIGRLPLREAIARAHAARSGQPVGPDNVVFLAGAQNALFASSLCLFQPGDEVLTFEPYYPTYPATIEVSGARLVRIPAAAGFRPNVAALESALTPHTRAVLWASPSNPSGMVLSEAELACIAALARRHDLWLIADEVYAGLARGGRVPSLGVQLPERVVTLGSLSKSHAMTGWRTGWLVGPEPLARNVELLCMCMLFGLPGFIQEAATTALSMAASAERRMREYCDARRARCTRALAGVRGIRPIEPEAGMFMLIDVSGAGLDGASFMRQLYAREKVSVMDGAAFGRATAGCVRVCYATDEASIERGCERIRRFCEARA